MAARADPGAPAGGGRAGKPVSLVGAARTPHLPLHQHPYPPDPALTLAAQPPAALAHLGVEQPHQQGHQPAAVLGLQAGHVVSLAPNDGSYGALQPVHAQSQNAHTK